MSKPRGHFSDVDPSSCAESFALSAMLSAVAGWGPCDTTFPGQRFRQDEHKVVSGLLAGEDAPRVGRDTCWRRFSGDCRHPLVCRVIVRQVRHGFGTGGKCMPCGKGARVFSTSGLQSGFSVLLVSQCWQRTSACMRAPARQVLPWWHRARLDRHRRLPNGLRRECRRRASWLRQDHEPDGLAPLLLRRDRRGEPCTCASRDVGRARSW